VYAGRQNIHIPDVGKPLCAQELLGNIEGCLADHKVFHKTDGDRFGRSIRRER